MNILDLFYNRKYDDILQKYYTDDFKKFEICKESKRFKEQCTLLSIVTISCAEKGFYYDFLENISRMYNLDILTGNPILVGNEIFVVDKLIEDLLYKMFNGDNQETTINDIKNVITFANTLTSKSQYFKDREKIFFDYTNFNKMPQYEIGIWYPYKPFFKDYTFDLTSRYPYISLGVKDKTREDGVGFTEFSVKRYGYMNMDSCWQGPRYDEKEKFYALKYVLPTINLMLLLTANGLLKRFIPIINLDQVSSVRGYLYNSEGKIVYGLLSTDFTAEFCGNNIAKYVPCDEELQNLNIGILQNLGCSHFVIMYQEAKNNLRAGLYVESFLLLCSVCEGMFYYWTKEIACVKKLFWSGGQELNNKRIIDACPEFETVVFTSACPSDYRSFFLDSYVWVFYHDKKLIRIILLNEVKEWILEHEDLYYVPDYIIESPSPNIYFNLNYSITSSDFSDEFKEEWFKAFYSKILNKENDELLRRINEDLIVYCEQKNYDIDMLQQLKFDEVVDFIFEFLSEHVYEELKTESNILNHENYTWIDYIEDGERIKTMPPQPTRDGHEFTGWYLDSKCTQKADFNSFVKDGKDTTFYAGWKQK